MSKFVSRSVRVVIAASMLVALIVPPAFADLGPVPKNVVVDGVSYYGKTEAELRAGILASKLKAQKMTVTIGTVKRTIDPGALVVVDAGTNNAKIDALVAQAYDMTSVADTSTPVELKVPFRVATSRTKVWLTNQNVKRAALDARRYLKVRKIYVRKARNGYRTDITGGTPRVIAAVQRSIDNTATPQSTTVKTIVVKPKVSTASLGKAIVVSLAQRKVTLYRTGSSSVEISYRCAVGMSKYPTPKGTWKIVAKNPRPGWTNPGSDWANGMPSYISPGPSNPLGLRALYLNASGIRIHGTSNYSSIGTAASHGCIRLRNTDIVKFYPRVPVGTTVYIVN